MTSGGCGSLSQRRRREVASARRLPSVAANRNNRPMPDPAAAPVLTLEHVARRLGGRTVVTGLDLSVRRGEVLGLLGVNGAGKTTTLRMLAGVLAPSDGTVRLCGADLYAEPALARRHIGYLPEQPPLYDELTVDEYLAFCARLRGLSGKAAAEAIETAIARCDLAAMRRRLAGALSKGYRQRLGLAQAIVHAPDLVVLDEPASGLDPVQALRLRESIRDLRAGHAVVLSTHVLSDVLACCDRVAILHRGRLRHLGPLAADEQTGAVLRIEVERALTPADWLGLPVVARAEALDARRWRVEPRAGVATSALAAAAVEAGFGLTGLRGENSGLDELFLRIAAEDAPVEAAA